MIVAVIDWTTIILAVITTLPAIIAAIYAGRVHAQVKTPSKTSIGKQVENALQTALANNYRLRSLNGENAPPTPAAVQAEDVRASAANGGT